MYILNNEYIAHKGYYKSNIMSLLFIFSPYYHHKSNIMPPTAIKL